MVDEPAGVVIGPSPQQVADETLNSFVVGLTPLRAELPNALLAGSLPSGKFPYTEG